MADIFDNIKSFEIPKRVFIVGGGPNGKDVVQDIPDDAFTIGVNSLITHSRIWTWWMAFDLAVQKYDWWPALVVPAQTKVLFGHTLAEVSRIKADYTFKFEPRMVHDHRLNRNPLMPGLLRGSLSIIGCAIQFAYYLGTEEIVLCGVDLFGHGHWDGFKNPIPTHKYEWTICPRMQWFIERLHNDRGVEFSTMSKTQLKLKEYKP